MNRAIETYNTSGINFISDKVCIGCEQEFTSYTFRGKYCTRDCHKKNRYRLSVGNPYWRLTKLSHMAKNRATTKNVPYDIDGDYLGQLWDKQEGCCAVSGMELDLEMSDKYLTNPQAPSVDRIIPALGYVRGNVRIVCYQVNMALSEYGEEQLIKMCKAIVAYR